MMIPIQTDIHCMKALLAVVYLDIYISCFSYNMDDSSMMYCWDFIYVTSITDANTGSIFLLW